MNRFKPYMCNLSYASLDWVHEYSTGYFQFNHCHKKNFLSSLHRQSQVVCKYWSLLNLHQVTQLLLWYIKVAMVTHHWQHHIWWFSWTHPTWSWKHWVPFFILSCRSTSEEFAHLFSADANLHFYQKLCFGALVVILFAWKWSKNMVPNRV